MKREDDTTEETEAPQPQPKRLPDGYYYDDSTGYEIYEPTNAGEDDDAEE